MHRVKRVNGPRFYIYKLGFLVLLAALSSAASETPFGEALDLDWQVSSLLNGSGLASRSLFDVAFERDARGGTKQIWVAASNGLHSFDGYQWHRYTTRNGLPSDFVRSVLVTRGGQLWVGTDKGAGTFNGGTFSTHGSERGLAGNNVRRIVEDSDGTLWFCSDSWPKATSSGGLTSFHNGRWHAWRSKDGLPTDYVVNYFRDSAGQRFAVTSGGVAELHGDRWTSTFKRLARGGLNWGSGTIAESSEAGLMVSTGTDVFVRKNGVWKAFRDTGNHEHGITATRDGKFLACGRTGPNRRAFVEWAGTAWKRVSASFPVIHDYVEEIAEAPDGSVYALGFGCLERWQRRGSEWRQYRDAPRPQLIDSQGRVWFLDDRGFYRETSGVWKNLGKLYKAITRSSDSSVWAWSESALTRWRGDEEKAYSHAETRIDRYLSVEVDAQGKLWAFGRGRDGRDWPEHLVSFDGKTWTEKRFPESKSVSGTPDPVSGMWYLAQRADSPDSASLVRVSNRTEIYPIPPGILSQYSNNIIADRSGTIWLFGDTGLYRWSRKNGAFWQAIEEVQGSNVIACLERNGELWFALDGTTGGKSGLMSFSSGRWKSFETDPLLSSSKAEDGTLLFGSENRFYVIPNVADAEPISVRLPEEDQVISIIKDKLNTYWLGTSQGTMLFHPDLIPPRTLILAADDQVLQGERYRARARGLRRFQVSGKTLNFWYSWRLDDGPWSAFDPHVERSFATERLHSGTHKLQVRSRDNGLITDPMPPAVDFQIHGRPIQERKWFLPAIIFTVLLLVALTMTAASARRKVARHARVLEQTVAERTAELVADIKRRETVEQALRSSEERRRMAADAGGMGTWFWNVCDGQMLWDDRCRQLLGLTRSEELHYKKFLRRVHQEDRGRVDSAIKEALNASGELDLEFRIILLDGSLRWIRSKGRTEANDTANGKQIVGIALDVTDLKRHQEEMRQANQVLKRSNEDLRQFAWAASHDLQEPLRMVVAYTQFLAKRYHDKLDESGNQYIAFAVNGAKRMQSLLQALLEYWQVSETRGSGPVPVDAAAALEKALGNLEASIVASGALVTCTGLPNVMASETALVQVFQNLIGNAIKYRKADERPRVHVSAEQGNDEWRFSVQDNGIGIAPEHQGLVFGIFKRLNGNRHQGAGIGLAICVKVVEHLGGRLWVESELGRGSSFHFTVPAVKRTEWRRPASLSERS